MRRIVAAINMTVDGYFDHTALTPDEEIHQHYEMLIRDADALLYGRITYQLMQFWQNLAQHPSGEKSMDDFAQAIDTIPKFVFSRTLQHTGWHSATLCHQPPEDIVAGLKRQKGRDVLVGSRSLIIYLMNRHLIDEFQLCIHPVVAGKGLALFENTTGRLPFSLTNTKRFPSGPVVLYYTRTG